MVSDIPERIIVNNEGLLVEHPVANVNEDRRPASDVLEAIVLGL